ncbi:uncharacterized protein LOC120635968 [Pararge aegeria]|uniref:uncharacterized protein LOC120635968 n=1 Tax=Pararge aegeria TaxID=116150 RepID=UPI0019D0D963|nr:uncharacterized protein LOC120635968 [Pararge aegeria]
MDNKNSNQPTQELECYVDAPGNAGITQDMVEKGTNEMPCASRLDTQQLGDAGPWPVDHPMPCPRWGGPRPSLHLTLQQYKELVTKAEVLISQLLVSHHYDSINNFLTLYRNYKATPDHTLKEFFPKYNPPIQPYKHTCVGLAIEVMKCLKSLETDFPGIEQSIMVVSCEENVEKMVEYTTLHQRPPEFPIVTEKDHVMVACHLQLDGRPGLFLSDLGYHVARLVTVMVDRGHPHTGWFTQASKPRYIKEFNYQFYQENQNYVEWHERETKADKVILQRSLVYVERAYLSAIEFTEKRNLVWDMKNLLARGSNGALLAGINFVSNRKETKVTVSYMGPDGVKLRNKLNVEVFLNLAEIPENVVQDVKECNEQLNMEEGMLMSILNELAVIMSNRNFVSDMLDLNELIRELTIIKK